MTLHRALLFNAEFTQRVVLQCRMGRFAVAALESEIEKQKKETASLEKALAVSDRHIDMLQRQLHDGRSQVTPDTVENSGMVLSLTLHARCV